MSSGQRLRQAIRDGILQIPGAPNALMARLIEQHGFDAIYLSGAAFSAGHLAIPDIGLFSLTELAQQTAILAESTVLPVIVDADTGFGDTVKVERTIVELERSGAAAIQLEDQELPKRCGHLSGKQLVSSEEMCRKLRAAVAARRDPDLVLVARTDARGVHDLDTAIQRAREYVEAGADWIFPEALASAEEFKAFAEAIDVPLLANMTEFGKSPLLTSEELESLGYAAVIYPVTLLRVAMKAAEAALGILAADGTQRELLDLMQTRQELYDLLEYDDYQERDRKHFGDELE